MPGLVYISTSTGAKFYALNSSIPTPDSTYVLQAGSDGSADRPPQTFSPSGSGGYPPYPTDGSYTDSHGTFTPSGGYIR